MWTCGNIQAVNRYRQTVLAYQCHIITSSWGRTRGLLGATLPAGHGIFLWRTRMIHTWFMSQTIDVVFLNRDYRVVHLLPSLPPWRISPYIHESMGVLELPAGVIHVSNTHVGDEIWLVCEG